MHRFWASLSYCNSTANIDLAEAYTFQHRHPPPPPHPLSCCTICNALLTVQGDAKKAVQDEVVKTLRTQSGFGDQLLEQMAHAHPTPGPANDDSAQR